MPKRGVRQRVDREANGVDGRRGKEANAPIHVKDGPLKLFCYEAAAPPRSRLDPCAQSSPVFIQCVDQKFMASFKGNAEPR